MDAERSLAVVIGSLGAGGAERVLSLMMAAWAREGLRIHLITWESPTSDCFPVPAGVARTVLGGSEPSPNPVAAIRANIRRILALRRALRESRAAATLSFLTPTNVLVILASLGLRSRTVVSERNDPLRQNPGAVWRILRRLCYPFADMVTANSTHARDVMSAFVRQSRLAVVPNPVGTPACCAHPDASRLILNVGRLVSQKRQHEIVGAFALLSRQQVNWQLIILGDGPLSEALQQQAASEGVAHGIFLPGHVPDPAQYYDKAAIFVMASAYEGTPNTLLEAMAHGLPCIVPDCLPGALEHVENGVSGLVFRAGNLDDLVRCLTELAGDPALRARLGAKARERMRHLSIENVIRQWNEVLFPVSS